MAEVQSAYAEGIGVTANSTTWVDVATIAAGSFTAGKKYLILATAYLEHASSANEIRFRIVHGTTPTVFTDGSHVYELTNGTQKTCWGYMTVFTQPGTAELVKIQISVSATNVGEAHLGNIFALNLSDNLVENTDWFFNEVTVDYNVTASLVAQAAVTFTPNGTDDWLIIANGVIDYAENTNEVIMSIHDSVSGVDEPRMDQEGEDATFLDLRSWMLARTFTPSNASHTFSARFAGETDTADLVLSSRIFAINLNKFRQHAFAYATAEEAPAATPSWTTTRTLAPNPEVTGNWFILGSFTNDVNNTDVLSTRLQVNAAGAGLASNPNYGDDAPESDSWDATDVSPFQIFTRVSLTSGATRDINLDVQMVSGTVLRVQERHLVAFSLELPAAAGPDVPRPPVIVSAVHRAASW